MRYGGWVVAVAALILAPVVPASADIQHFGVDIGCTTKPLGGAGSCSTGSALFTQVGFYDGQVAKGGNTGVTLSGPLGADTSITFTILTPITGGQGVDKFDLFLDANVVSDTASGSLFRIELKDGSTFISVGFALSTPPATTLTPTDNATFGDHVLSPYFDSDIDNTFFLRDPAGIFEDEIEAGALDVRITALGSSARFDGVNLEVETSLLPPEGCPPNCPQVPEPSSLLLLGAGLVGIGLGGTTWRRLRRK